MNNILWKEAINLFMKVQDNRLQTAGIDAVQLSYQTYMERHALFPSDSQRHSPHHLFNSRGRAEQAKSLSDPACCFY